MMTRSELINQIDFLYTMIKKLTSVPDEMIIRYINLCTDYSKIFGGNYNGRIIY